MRPHAIGWALACALSLGCAGEPAETTRGSASQRPGSTPASSASAVASPATSSSPPAAALSASSAPPVVSVDEAGLSALMAGGSGLSALPVRATDDGRGFDPSLVERLKPRPEASAPGAKTPRCNPMDPLCDP